MKKIIILLIYIYIFLTTVKNFTQDTCIDGHKLKNIVLVSKNHSNELKKLNNQADLLFAEFIASQLKNYDQKMVILISDLRQKIKQINDNYHFEVKSF